VASWGGRDEPESQQLEDVPYIPTYQNAPAVEAYFQRSYEERQRRLGQRARLIGATGTVFPNMSILSRQPRSIAVWHPRGALQTEAWRWFLVDADAPVEVKEVLHHDTYAIPGRPR
jgi:Ring hydroxylating alpha subunit (catalytic domain)